MALTTHHKYGEVRGFVMAANLWGRGRGVQEGGRERGGREEWGEEINEEVALATHHKCGEVRGGFQPVGRGRGVQEGGRERGGRAWGN